MSLIGESTGWRLVEEGDRVRVAIGLDHLELTIKDGWLALDVPRELFHPLASEWQRHVIESNPQKGDLFDLLVSAVSEAHRMRIGKVLSDRSGRKPQQARHLIWYLARKHANLSYPEIARPFGMDHTAVLKAVRRVRARVEAGEEGWVSAIREIEEQLGLPHDVRSTEED